MGLNEIRSVIDAASKSPSQRPPCDLLNDALAKAEAYLLHRIKRVKTDTDGYGTLLLHPKWYDLYYGDDE